MKSPFATFAAHGKIGGLTAARNMTRKQRIRRARLAARARHAKPAAVCAWCSKELGRVDPPGTSHTICARHSAAEFERMKLTMTAKKMLDHSRRTL